MASSVAGVARSVQRAAAMVDGAVGAVTQIGAALLLTAEVVILFAASFPGMCWTGLSSGPMSSQRFCFCGWRCSGPSLLCAAMSVCG